MSKHEAKVREAFKRIDDHDFASLSKSYVDDVDVVMNGQALPGLEAYKGMITGWLAAFPDLEHHLSDYLEDGDRAAYRLRITGTHTGPMQTPGGTIPATGKRCEFHAVNSVRFGADGRAVAWHSYFDMVEMLEQLGLA